jgi:hypothetical protein
MEFHTLVDRVRSEFKEMPCLRLTLPQASRLWGLDRATSQHVINALVGSEFLRWTPDGKIARAV